MTGLNPNSDVILEIASIITDSDGNIIDQGPDLVIHQPQEKLDAMDILVSQMHTSSGLVKAVRTSSISVQEAEQKTLAFFKQHCAPDTALLAGNSVWQDRNFLQKYMPSIVHYSYYRLLDVTAIKEVVARWYPDSPHAAFEKKETHRALTDIRESIAELRHFRKYFFIKA